VQLVLQGLVKVLLMVRNVELSPVFSRERWFLDFILHHILLIERIQFDLCLNYIVKLAAKSWRG